MDVKFRFSRIKEIVSFCVTGSDCSSKLEVTGLHFPGLYPDQQFHQIPDKVEDWNSQGIPCWNYSQVRVY
jgi:hypothetical protein